MRLISIGTTRGGLHSDLDHSDLQISQIIPPDYRLWRTREIHTRNVVASMWFSWATLEKCQRI